MEAAKWKENKQDGLGVFVWLSWTLVSFECCQVCEGNVMLGPDNANKQNEDENKKLDAAEHVVDDNTPVSGYGVKHAAQGIDCHGYRNDDAWCHGVLRSFEHVLCKRDRVGGCIAENNKCNSEETDCQKTRLFDEILELCEVRWRLLDALGYR
jgi:hypothetical protein